MKNVDKTLELVPLQHRERYFMGKTFFMKIIKNKKKKKELVLTSFYCLIKKID